MSDAIPFASEVRAKRAVCTTLLIARDVIKENTAENVDTVLSDGVFYEAVNSGMVPAGQADWIVRETRYQVAVTLGVPVEGRDDPIIDAALAVLAIQPADRQVRVLEATADQYAAKAAANADGEQEPCMICGAPAPAFLCTRCERATK